MMRKHSMPIPFGLWLIGAGLVIIIVVGLDILISTDLELWRSVLERFHVSPLIIFFIYSLFGFGILLVILGSLTIATRDKTAT